MLNKRCKPTILILALLSGVLASTAHAASHREAPLIAKDPTADITDVYTFASYDQENLNRKPEDRKVTFIMNVIPGQEPGSGPNYYDFDDLVRYQFIVDNDRDGSGLDDIVYEFEFKTSVTNPSQFIRPVAGVGPLPPVTELDGAGAAGLASIQYYRITELRGCRNTRDGLRDCKRRTRLFDGGMLPTVPSNIGPRTMPNYEDLANKGIFLDQKTGIRVFAGQRAETFAIDLGAVFDTLNFRRGLPVQTVAEDANDKANPFGANNFSGFNINTIALEVPIRRLTADGMSATDKNKLIGMWARTLRQQETKRVGVPLLNANMPPKKLIKGEDTFVQVSRMANPLVNELIIRFGRKDFWNATLPEDEAIFLNAYRYLDVASALQLVSGVPVKPNPREDIVQLLLKYPGQNPSPKVGPFSELLRLDMTVPPTPPAQIKRLGPFAHDAAGNATPDSAGFPNGRRPNDDVTDIVVRVAGGTNFIMNRVGDGVGIQEQGITPTFPFLPTPYDGRNRRHVDCDEADANPCN
jgi:hypothetical protein